MGEYMATRCDHFMQILITMMANEGMEESPASSGAEMSGVVKGVSTENVVVLSIKSGKSVEKIYVLGEFEGMDLIKKASKLKGKKVNIHYEETEIYSPEKKGVVTVKELLAIELSL
jgi:hypothetical protein